MRIEEIEQILEHIDDIQADYIVEYIKEFEEFDDLEPFIELFSSLIDELEQYSSIQLNQIIKYFLKLIHENKFLTTVKKVHNFGKIIQKDEGIELFTTLDIEQNPNQNHLQQQQQQHQKENQNMNWKNYYKKSKKKIKKRYAACTS